MTASQGQRPSPRNRTLGLMKNAGKPWRLGEHWTRECAKVENSGETLSAFRRSQAQARWLFNQKKRQSWAEYVSKLSTNTPIKHVWDRVRKISGKNICPPKQYLNGKDGAAITNPKDIANEHAAAFTDNSSSTHYSATFQTIKVQEEKVKIDFTSDNTEVYNKPFRLRDLRRSIMEAKPVHLDLTGSTTICWSISLRTGLRS